VGGEGGEMGSEFLRIKKVRIQLLKISLQSRRK
jgi:hypothetical protein